MFTVVFRLVFFICMSNCVFGGYFKIDDVEDVRRVSTNARTIWEGKREILSDIIKKEEFNSRHVSQLLPNSIRRSKMILFFYRHPEDSLKDVRDSMSFLLKNKQEIVDSYGVNLYKVLSLELYGIHTVAIFMKNVGKSL